MTTALTKLCRLSNPALLMSQPFRINLNNNAIYIKVKTNYTYATILVYQSCYFSPLLVSSKAYVQYQMTKLSLPKPNEIADDKFYGIA